MMALKLSKQEYVHFIAVRDTFVIDAINMDAIVSIDDFDFSIVDRTQIYYH